MPIKKFLMFIFVFAFFGLLLACGGTTTQAPTTQAPTTQAPTTQAPTTQAPTTQAPTTQAPTTQAPTTQAPTTQPPTTQAPTTQPPTTQPPTTEAVFNVVFNVHGGSEVAAQSVTSGDLVSVPENPTLEGFIFDGWYTSDDYEVKWNFATNVVVGHMTLHAKWLVLDYDVLFNPSNQDVYVFEAEDAQIVGTPSYGSVFIEEIAIASGGRTVGYMGVVGNGIIWTVNASEDVTVMINLVMSSSLMNWTTYVVTDQPINPTTFEVKVNGVAITYPEYLVPGSNQSMVFNQDWGNFVIDGINLVEGQNTIEIAVLSSSAGPNIDVLKIRSASELSGGSSTEPVEGYEGEVSYSLVIEGFEWGPSVTKIVLYFEDDQINEDAFDIDTFRVMAGTTARTVVDAYLSDEFGNEIEGNSSNYVTLGLQVGFAANQWGGSPIQNSAVFSYTGGVNIFRALDIYSVSLQTGQSLVIDSAEYEQVNVLAANYNGRISPDTDNLLKDSFSDETNTLTYAAFETEDMKNDGGKNSLIIWLHGAGEGGTNVDVALLGNEAVALFKDPIQSYFRTDSLEGAYVLVVQTPTMWMNSGSGQHSGNQPSIYTALLMATIQHYVSTNGDIDESRIYLGGCSNGGYMTMNMIIEYPNYFAAAYPICQAYMDSYIDATKLAILKDTPIWFVTAANDPTVSPTNFTVATYVRLVQAGAENVHLSYFTSVIGTDEPGANYNGHWSWILLFNDGVSLDQNKALVLADGASAVVAPSSEQVLVDDQVVNIWQWLAAQNLPEAE